MANKGFIKDYQGNLLLPITRGELVLDRDGKVAFNSQYFLAGENGSLYGLVTAAERAMLNGSVNGSTGGIKDIYDKLEFINSGIKVNETSLHFYDSNNTHTPITFVSEDSNVATIKLAANNTILFGLNSITTQKTLNTFIRSISVDLYGRVTDVNGGNLENSDIPNALSGKVLNECTTTNEITNDSSIYAIVNKGYVDAKVGRLEGVATGALKFAGSIPDKQTAENIINLASTNANNYYKVTSLNSFYISDGFIFGSEDQNSTTKISRGDTLIVYNNKFVHIPSGDDIITSITVSGYESVNDTIAGSIIEGVAGNIFFDFSSYFILTKKPGYNNLAINIEFNPNKLPRVSKDNAGVFTPDDYNIFLNLKGAYELSGVSYEPIITNGYAIGKLTINGNDNIIYGLDTSLSLLAGVNGNYNPILRFAKGSNNTDFTLQGGSGILILKLDNTVIVNSSLNIHSDSEDYLELDENHNLKVKLGSLSGSNVINGLVDFATLDNYALNSHMFYLLFEPISYSLLGSENDLLYRYGNEKLITAVTLENL